MSRFADVRTPKGEWLTGGGWEAPTTSAHWLRGTAP
jgi:hypothetical protein